MWRVLCQQVSWSYEFPEGPIRVSIYGMRYAFPNVPSLTRHATPTGIPHEALSLRFQENVSDPEFHHNFLSLMRLSNGKNGRWRDPSEARE